MKLPALFLSHGAPTLASLSPTSGDIGDSITLTGTNFTSVSAVRFNGLNASYTVDSLTSIRATVPVAATTGVVTVVTSRGTATSADVFTVVRNPVLISQVYGAGGITGASHNADYVELHNRGDSTVSPRRCACVDRPRSTPSERSSTGWVPRTS